MDESYEDDIIEHDGYYAFNVEDMVVATSSIFRPIVAYDDEDELSVRIGLIGVPSSKKQLLARELSEHLNVPIIVNLIARANENGFKLDDRNPISYVALWLALMYEQNDLDEFVSEFTFLDFCAFMSLAVKKKKSRSLNALLNVIQNNTLYMMYDHYTGFLYIPPEAQTERNMLWDQKIVQLIYDMDIDAFPVVGDTYEDCVDMAVTYLHDIGIKKE
jgi:hypothetical protein